MKFPSAGSEDVGNVQRHDVIASPTIRSFMPPGSGTFSSVKKKIQIKFNERGRPHSGNVDGRENDKAPIASSSDINRPIGDSHVNDGFKFDGSPRRLGLDFIDSILTTNPSRFPGGATHHRTNHQHGLIPHHRSPNHHRNRFYANQNGNKAAAGGKLIGNEMPAGAINDPHSPDLNTATEMKAPRDGNGPMTDGNYALKSPPTPPNSVDVLVTFNKSRKPDHRVSFYQRKNLETGKNFNLSAILKAHKLSCRLLHSFILCNSFRFG